MSWARTVTVTRKKPNPSEQNAAERMGLKIPPLFRMRCDHHDAKTGKSCTFRPEGTHEYVTNMALTHTHEPNRTELNVRWGTLRKGNALTFTTSESW